MKSYIANQIREIAREIILDALENGDAIKTAKELREEIRAGWHAALADTGVPEDALAGLVFPI
jgi:hypothetical protein